MGETNQFEETAFKMPDFRQSISLEKANRLLISGLGEGSVPVTSQSIALLDAFQRVPRHEFIEPAFHSRAYEDTALPIGFGQTISKPSTVLGMLAPLNVTPGTKVLEIGAGSGYVCAVLSELGAQVFGVERVSRLAQLARNRLDRLGYQRVLIRCADGLRGWSEHAPFDAIIVSAALEIVPQRLFEQLGFGGRLIAPVKESRDPESTQRLQFCVRLANGEIESRDCGSCQFVDAT